MRLSVASLLLVSLCGCSSITSMQVVPDKKSDGLIYHLPKRDFIVTITRTGSVFTDVTVATSAPYADLATTYVVAHNTHMLAKNKLTVEVSDGLLTSSKATTTIDIDAIAKSIGGAGAIGIARIMKSEDKQVKEEQCAADGAHVFIFKRPVEAFELCGKDGKGIIVRITALSDATPVAVASRTSPGTPDSGLFYRMNRPYLVTANGAGLNKAAIVTSPSESQPYFLPVSQGLFTTNDADFTFVGGIPTKYIQETDGELVALLKLPAKVLEEYFDAIAAAFGKSKANAKAETDALQETLNLEIAKKKVEACLEALKSKSDTAFNDLKCGDK